MSNLVKPGEHTARITDYTVVETKNGKAMVRVKFETAEGTVFWNGVIGAAQEGQRNYTMESLIAMGVQSFDDLGKLSDGLDSKVLDTNTDLRIKVDHEEYNGKIYAKAIFVNKIGGFQDAMAKDSLKIKLAGIPGLKADFAAAWQQTGAKVVTKKAEAKPLDEIPF